MVVQTELDELWNARAGKEDMPKGNDISMCKISYGTMQRFLNDRANEGYTRFTVWKE